MGNILRTPLFEGKLIMPSGKACVKVKSDCNNENLRAKITFNLKGDILQ